MRGTVTGFSKCQGWPLPDVLGDDGVLYRLCDVRYGDKYELGDRVEISTDPHGNLLRYKLDTPQDTK